jgi:Glu-tRNA(Gln) amidotransferase subunit E-like FAD-binding protein
MLEKIKELIHNRKKSKATNLKKAIINGLTIHGKDGIPPIIEIISSSNDMMIKEHGFKVINKIIEKQEKKHTRIITALRENYHQAI